VTTKVEKSVLVNVPLSVAYNQWTQFEEFPQFMGGITSVTQLADDRLQWVAEIAGIRRQWEAQVVEQIPDRRVAWAATEGATNAGSVTFEDVGGGQTSVHLSLEYEPEGLVENVGDKLGVIENRAESDLDRFKAFIESEGYASGAWRGAVVGDGRTGTPGVEDAAETRGDSGKAGVSGKAVAAGLGVAAAAATAVGLAAANREETPVPKPPVPTPPPSTTGPAAVPETPVAPAADLPGRDSGTVEPGHVLTSDEIDASVEDNEGHTRHDA
jgi:ribosome-associated toxin RatA of RatAB toxin-antitoxin module